MYKFITPFGRKHGICIYVMLFLCGNIFEFISTPVTDYAKLRIEKNEREIQMFIGRKSHGNLYKLRL